VLPFYGTDLLTDACVRIFKADYDGHCRTVCLPSRCRNIVVINVYFPCHNTTIVYRSALNEYAAFTESVINNNSCNCDVTKFGDTNFSHSAASLNFQIFRTFIDCV
jgi:exonuclease III